MIKRIMITFIIVMMLVAASVIIIAKNIDHEIKAYNIMDEYGSVYEVIETDKSISIKYMPNYYENATTWRNYIENRYKSWGEYKNLIDDFGNEYFTAYVLPCHLLTPSELIEILTKYNLTRKLTLVIVNVYLKNGSWLWNSYITINDNNAEKVIEKIINTEVEAVENLRRRFSDPEYLKILIENNATSSIPFNITFEDIDIYVESFLLKDALKELSILKDKPEVLMVDLPLDIIARFKSNNEKSVIEINRVIFGEPWLNRETNYCKTIKCRCKE